MTLDVAADSFAHRVAEDRVALLELDHMIPNLLPEQREVISIVSIEGHSHCETAKILDAPIGRVVSRMP